MTNGNPAIEKRQLKKEIILLKQESEYHPRIWVNRRNG